MSLINIEKTIELDVYDHDTTPSVIKTVQLDTGTRTVYALIQNSKQTYDIGQNASVSLTVLRPDNTRVQITGQTFGYTGADNTMYGAKVDLSDVALAVKGNLKAQFKFISGEQELRTEIFAINNGEALDAGDGDWAGDLDGHNLDEMAQDIEDAKAAVSEMESDVSELKSGFNDLPNNLHSDAENVDLDITDTNGNVILRLSGGNIQTKKYNSANSGQYMADSADNIDLDITDEAGNVILRLASGHIKTKNFDSQNIPATNEGGIVYRNSDAVDAIYASCRYHQPTRFSKQFCMLIAGDIHEDAERMNSIVEYLNAIDCIDAGIMLGDIAGINFNSDTVFYTNAIANANKPFLTVIGNHDAGSDNLVANCYTDIADLWAKLIEPNIGKAQLTGSEYTQGNTYYYKDFATYGIRVIVLNQYEYPTDNDGTNFIYRHGWSCYSQAQITWLCATLASVPSDWGVIIAIHSNPHSVAIDHSSILTSSTMQYNSITPETNMDTTNGGILVDIVDAWINGTSLTETYGYTVSGTWDSIDVDVDFSSRGPGEFICWIGGHWHMSLKSVAYHHTNQHMYTVACASLGSGTSGDMPRKEGVRSEDCCCVMSVDRDKKTVKIVLVGAHYTKDAIDRKYSQFAYKEG